MFSVFSLALGTLLLGMLTTLGIAIRNENIPAVVNAIASFAVTILPVVLEWVARWFGHIVAFGPELPLAIGVVGLLHSYGMLGSYDEVWWWDNLTHTLAAAIIAALFYSGLAASVTSGVTAFVTTEMVAPITVVFVFLVGVFWELVELVSREAGKQFDIDPVLVHYGWRDTALDLLFDVVGALIVVFFGIMPFVGVASAYPGTTWALIQGSVVLVVLGSIGLAVLIFTNILGRS